MNNEILKNILSLEDHFDDYEFIHAYLGPEEYKIKVNDPKIPYNYINNILINNDVAQTDEFPYFRKTYIKDFINSITKQAEFYIFKNDKLDFIKIIEGLFAVKLMPKFNLEEELNKTNKDDLKKINEKISFNSSEELKNYIDSVINTLSSKMITLYGKQIPELEKVIKLSKIDIVNNEEANPPCFYKYNGNYKGTVGFKFKNQYLKYYIDSFLMHEVMPGHHLYYLLRQNFVDTNKIDPIIYIDTFYSPENIINEGLAINTDLILNKGLDSSVSAMLKKEKLYHKVMYNCWYDLNINKKEADPICEHILCDNMGYSKAYKDSMVEYFTVSDKYYAPCYPIGGFVVEKAINVIGTDRLKYFYPQHSVSTINKLVEYFNGKK